MRLPTLAALVLAGSLAACSANGDEQAAEAAQEATAEAAPYPIVLAHGFFGFKDFAGLDFITYFNGVADHLRAHGEPRVFTPTVDPFSDSEFRGKELVARIEDILRETGAKKVNLIGHSQGGLDARYVAHVRPDLVASVTTIAAPHRGMPIADLAFGLLWIPFSGPIIDSFVQVLGGPLWDEVGNETSLAKAIKQFSTPAIEAFNATYTDVPGIPYFSVAGRTAGSLGEDDCKTDDSPPFISRWSATRDTTDVLLKPMELVVAGVWGKTNDGLIRVESAKWGTFLGCVPADHFDEIGQLFGDPAGLGNGWKYLDFYSDLVGFLRARRL